MAETWTNRCILETYNDLERNWGFVDKNIESTLDSILPFRMLLQMMIIVMLMTRPFHLKGCHFAYWTTHIRSTSPLFWPLLHLGPSKSLLKNVFPFPIGKRETFFGDFAAMLYWKKWGGGISWCRHNQRWPRLLFRHRLKHMSRPNEHCSVLRVIGANEPHQFFRISERRF